MNKVIQGDCSEKLKELEDNSVDSIVTDPPYELGFMGKSWDNTGIANNKEMWAECLRVLKSGGHLLAFGGTRTYHRMAVAIEDAGFEVRDMINWCYGSGFSKCTVWSEGAKRTSKRLNKENDLMVENGWKGWGRGGLKPAHEPIAFCRKPIEKGLTVAENVLKYGTGGINIDESRVDYQSEADKASATPQGKCTSNTSAGSAPDVDMSEVDYNGEKYWYKNEYKWLIDKWLNDEDYVWSELKENLETYNWCKVPDIDSGDRVLFDSQEGVCIRLYESKRKEFERPDQLGRFPANLIHDNSEEVRECFPEAKGWSSQKHNNFNPYGGNAFNKSETTRDGYHEGFNDSGNASRFFKSIIYQAKASKAERNRGCEGLEKDVKGMNFGGELAGNGKPINIGTNKNFHPTVKPIALMEYLIKMVTPKGGIVLDPFAGSGTTLVAAKQNGFQYIGIELTEEYIPIIEARLNALNQDKLL